MAAKDDLALVRLRLAQGADVNARARTNGATALYEAVRVGNRPMITLLLKAGADVSLTQRDGAGPLWLAAFKRDAATVKRLLAHHPPLDGERFNPLEAAVEAGYLTIAQVLLAAGAIPTGRHLLKKAASAGEPLLVSAMLQAGLRVELEKKDPNGWTPLLAAISNRHWETAEALLKAGAKLDSKVGRFRPLELARERGGEAAVLRLQAFTKR